MTQWLEPGRTGAAPVELGEIFAGIFGPRAPVRFSAYDGSEAGQADAQVSIRLVRPRAASYLATAPSIRRLTSPSRLSGRMGTVDQKPTLTHVSSRRNG